MKTLINVFGFILFVIMVMGCTPKPSDKFINDFLKKEYSQGTKKVVGYGGGVESTFIMYKNVEIINKWADENVKGKYYVKVRYYKEYYNGNKFNEEWTKILGGAGGDLWQFEKQGDVWVLRSKDGWPAELLNIGL